MKYLSPVSMTREVSFVIMSCTCLLTCRRNGTSLVKHWVRYTYYCVISVISVVGVIGVINVSVSSVSSVLLAVVANVRHIMMLPLSTGNHDRRMLFRPLTSLSVSGSRGSAGMTAGCLEPISE